MSARTKWNCSLFVSFQVCVCVSIYKTHTVHTYTRHSIHGWCVFHFVLSLVSNAVVGARFHHCTCSGWMARLLLYLHWILTTLTTWEQMLAKVCAWSMLGLHNLSLGFSFRFLLLSSSSSLAQPLLSPCRVYCFVRETHKWVISRIKTAKEQWKKRENKNATSKTAESFFAPLYGHCLDGHIVVVFVVFVIVVGQFIYILQNKWKRWCAFAVPHVAFCSLCEVLSSAKWRRE